MLTRIFRGLSTSCWSRAPTTASATAMVECELSADETPLHVALRYGAKYAVRLLVEFGADVSALCRGKACQSTSGARRSMGSPVTGSSAALGTTSSRTREREEPV